MASIHPALQVAMTALALLAAAGDYRGRRIPNLLALTGLILGLFLNTALDGSAGLLAFLQGFSLALLIYIPLFVVRAVGGGDVKLMVAMGSIAGPENWLLLFILTSIAGGIHAIVLLLRRGSIWSAVRNSGQIVRQLVRGRLPFRSQPELDVNHPRALSIPHAYSVAAGTLLLLFA